MSARQIRPLGHGFVGLHAMTHSPSTQNSPMDSSHSFDSVGAHSLWSAQTKVAGVVAGALVKQKRRELNSWQTASSPAAVHAMLLGPVPAIQRPLRQAEPASQSPLALQGPHALPKQAWNRCGHCVSVVHVKPGTGGGGGGGGAPDARQAPFV